MARQKGHVKYVGTLGEVRHFKIKGNTGYYAGLKGGPTAEQVKTAALLPLLGFRSWFSPVTTRCFVVCPNDLRRPVGQPTLLPGQCAPVGNRAPAGLAVDLVRSPFRRLFCPQLPDFFAQRLDFRVAVAHRGVGLRV